MKEMVKLTGVTLSPGRKVMVMPNTYKKTEKDPDYFFYWGQRKEGAVKTRQGKRFITGGGLKCGKN
ncbi:MAG: hypothetical protein CVU62_12685 [Deltaproteobacteria bacterium HGW-Deltaproteobacteria-2]|jgi:hypothetical protein|nr:MAG: hypothetical protein CVU62_12685 [Deltaproteobacteria bacterium HGW-Deltaproteobacteria-2]